MPETPVFATAAVVAPHPAVAGTGQTILAAGGNAIEAAIAMAATASVLCPRWTALGGDGAWLVREPGGRVHALEAAGPAGALAEARRYRSRGHDVVPLRGAEAALTVAGAVGGWGLALDLARALGAKLPLDLLLGDAIKVAGEGYPVAGDEGDLAPSDREALLAAPGFAASFLTGEGKFPQEGERRRLPRLADALGRLAHAGLRDFYRGDVGREIAADLERIGSPVRRRDLESYRSRVVTPPGMRLESATLHGLPPPGLGLAWLLSLGIAERLEPGRGEAARVHGLIEATKRALALCGRAIAAADEGKADPAAFLDPAFLEKEAAAIDAGRAAPFAGPLFGPVGSVWIGCIDRSGLAVSCVQSIGPAFGSGCVLPATGIHWQAQGRGFSLDPAGRNSLAPGERPVQGPGPGLASFTDGRALVFGAGGAVPAVLAQVFSHAERGLAAAVEAPRWALVRDEESEVRVQVEESFDPGLAQDLIRRGQNLREGPPGTEAFGRAGMILRHPGDGRVAAACDPRGSGAVMGL